MIMGMNRPRLRLKIVKPIVGPVSILMMNHAAFWQGAVRRLPNVAVFPYAPAISKTQPHISVLKTTPLEVPGLAGLRGADSTAQSSRFAQLRAAVLAVARSFLSRMLFITQYPIPMGKTIQSLPLSLATVVFTTHVPIVARVPYLLQ